jgi:hypothetical protein
MTGSYGRPRTGYRILGPFRTVPVLGADGVTPLLPG